MWKTQRSHEPWFPPQNLPRWYVRLVMWDNQMFQFAPTHAIRSVGRCSSLLQNRVHGIGPTASVTIRFRPQWMGPKNGLEREKFVDEHP